MYTFLCFIKVTVISTVQCQVITIVEHPFSLLVPANESALFSCTARVQCSTESCSLKGQWIINHGFIDRSHDQYGHNELTLNWRMINSDSQLYRNNSVVRCHFRHGSVIKDSDTASLVLIDGELLSIHIT